MKHDYTALDAAIKEALKSGPKTFRNIESYPKVKEEAAKLAAVHNSGYSIYEKVDAWRFVDSRLQALRKSGAIIHIDQAGGWALKEQA